MTATAATAIIWAGILAAVATTASVYTLLTREPGPARVRPWLRATFRWVALAVMGLADIGRWPDPPPPAPMPAPAGPPLDYEDTGTGWAAIREEVL